MTLGRARVRPCPRRTALPAIEELTSRRRRPGREQTPGGSSFIVKSADEGPAPVGTSSVCRPCEVITAERKDVDAIGRQAGELGVHT